MLLQVEDDELGSYSRAALQGNARLQRIERVERCKKLCYADADCGYWFHFNHTCWVERKFSEDDSYQVNASTSVNLRYLQMDAGEKLTRGCPHSPHPAWEYVGISALSLGIFIFIWAICQGKGKTRKQLLAMDPHSAGQV